MEVVICSNSKFNYTLELYRTAHFRCPQLSVQAWVRTMADLHDEVYARYRSRQFSIAYDLYLAVRAHVQSRVDKALNHEDPGWNIKHLKDEQEMRFSILWAEDGNDSLKRFERRATPEEGGLLLGSSVKSLDTRTHMPGSMYISREEIDQWAPVPGAARDPEEDTDDVTARSWGCFGETGIFASFCRHGFNLTITDMYRSGEGSKYGLGTAAKMLKAHSKKQGAGLDIGCSHMKTLFNSALGPLARQLEHTVLVDVFHGHAHNRLCQLSNLTHYVDGLGLEALGVCEQAFSKSNVLAGSTRSMSRFHHQQAIAAHCRDTDNYENYMTITTYIEMMYKKALGILKDYPAALVLSKAALGITGTPPFKDWLVEEKSYLQSLKKEPPQETLAMEYHQRVTHLWHCDTLLQAVRSIGFHPTDPMARDQTNVIESRRCHAIKNHETTTVHVQNLELCLGIQTRWTAQSAEYLDMGRVVSMRNYQHALDTVEGLVVARLFELGSMNRAGMGYKRRRHMGEALTSRSAAIRTAVDRYNIAALALSLPCEVLNIKEVVECTFLADFDLLRDTHQDIRLRDEENYLKHHKNRVRITDPILAHQITIHCNIRGRFNAHHHLRLSAIARLEGFSGSLQPGITSWCPTTANTADHTGPNPISRGLAPTSEEVELEGEQEDDEDEAEEREDEADVLAVIMDHATIKDS
ncbi:hypothetical protein FIBSPDRAFT_913015 [Athelia psychrophila]|uniref:CxC2-like cysteine cluster KDZ transposase-associated domain-containing protein n=1 Tax=Athelia psychrophila TaxID=1759441 RepID=A0A166CII8_9AGAM|nr:hypothetical protein FIBSPDRAFT_913015 [Fibularhizoctonia sp. CBS 109695]